LKKLLALIAFSVLLLVPVGIQNAFADHPDLDCPPPGILISDPGAGSTAFGSPYCLEGFNTLACSPGYTEQMVSSVGNIGVGSFTGCVAQPQSTPDPTLPGQCQGATVLLNNHCFEQVLSAIGGVLMNIDTTALLVASIGTNPVITGLVALTMAGIAGQAAWFIHRRKKKKK